MNSIDLVGKAEASRNGVALGAAPNPAVFTLLSGLAVRDDAWSSRDELAGKLYPNQPREQALNALRQTIFRLRQWLGHDVLEHQKNCLRLCGRPWKLILTDGVSERASGLALAPGIDHPWMTELRRLWCSDPEPRSRKEAMLTGLAESVRQISAYDPDIGRSVFVGAANALDQFSTAEFSELAGLTKPKTLHAPFASEYWYMCGLVSHHAGLLKLSQQQCSRSIRAAKAARNREMIAASASTLFYTAVEQGDEAEIANVRPLLLKHAPELTLGNTLMCALWNEDRSEDAVQLIRSASKSILLTTRSEQAHFWTNVAYFAADIGDAGMCEEAIDACETVIIPELEITWQINLLLSKCRLRLMQREAREALRLNDEACQISGEFDRKFPKAYMLESRVEALSALGYQAQAQATWSLLRKRREAMSASVRPRLLRIRERALGC